MLMKWMHAIAVTVLAVGLAACTKPKQVQPEAGTQAPATTTESGATTSGLGSEAGAGAASGAGALTAQQQALAELSAKNTVYFAYDSSEIQAEYVPVVAAHAAYLVKYPAARVRIEGHTDERGSREYNIGLGERRGQAVRKALMLQGVADGQITTISYGEERPAAEGHDEAAYAQNRRAVLVEIQ
jgi:peptidoglycan-associated lipoprotein